MFRRWLVTSAMLVFLAAAFVNPSSAQNAYGAVDRVAGQVLQVQRGPCQIEPVDGTITQMVCRDRLLVEYYPPDGTIRSDWIDVMTFTGGVRPAAGDDLNCEIDADTEQLLDVSGWYHHPRANIYFYYGPSYGQYRYGVPWYWRPHYRYRWPQRHYPPTDWPDHRRYRGPDWPPHRYPGPGYPPSREPDHRYHGPNGSPGGHFDRPPQQPQPRYRPGARPQRPPDRPGHHR